MVEATGLGEDRWQHCRETAIALGSGRLMNIARYGRGGKLAKGFAFTSKANCRGEEEADGRIE